MNKKLIAFMTLGVLIGFGSTAQSAHADTNIYRLYNPNITGQNHFWTSSLGEDQALMSSGWSDEGVKWVEGSSGTTPIYRLRSASEHYYTTSQAERDALVKKGWSYESVMGYSVGTIPVYDLYKSGSGHYFTTDTNEVKNLKNMGYGSQKTAFYAKAVVPTGVLYQANIQNRSWSAWMVNSEMAGTTGKGLIVSGIKMKINLPGTTGGIQYRTQVQNIGWQGWVANGVLAGTTNPNQRIEALQVELTGQLAQQYSVKYRAQGQNYGWQAWVTDGATAGTVGQGLRLEAIEVILVPKIAYNKADNAQFYTYSGIKGDVNYPQFEYLDSSQHFQPSYQNNNQYAVYNNTAYNLNAKLLKDAQNADYANWQARQSWQAKLNQYGQTINADQTTLDAAKGQQKKYNDLVNQENTYIAQEKQNNLPTTQDETLLAEYTKDLQTATANVTTAQTQLTNDTNTRTSFQNLGTDFVKLNGVVTRDVTGRTVTITYTQTTQSAGTQTQKVWTYSQALSN